MSGLGVFESLVVLAMWIAVLVGGAAAIYFVVRKAVGDGLRDAAKRQEQR